MPSPFFTLFCAAVAATALALAYWQHQRAALKDELQSRAEERAGAPAVDLAAIAGLQRDELLWRPVFTAGSYDAQGQFLIDNRIVGHRPGFHVIAPLALERGGWLLVNRGWMPLPQRRENVAAPAPPAGAVTVSGILVADAADAFRLADETGAGVIRQNLSIAAWEQDTGRQAFPAVLLTAEPGLTPVAWVPDFRADRSRGYRLQWLGLALVAVAGWFAFAWRKGARR